MAHAAALAAAAALAGWTHVATAPHGGTVWSGRIPGSPSGSVVYVPPGYRPTRRYPVLYLLHGVPGSPTEYWGSLQLAARLDDAFAAGTPPFLVVTPHGPDRGEWAGTWERFVVADVVPFIDRHLATQASAAGRTIEGLSAGGFGAIDIGLRHPGLFGTLGSWDGYFTAPRDGPLARATRAELLAHDPARLVAREALLLRRTRVRFYISVGGNHGAIRAAGSHAFAAELKRLRLTHELWVLPKADTGHFWTATVPSALRYAFPAS